VAELLEAIGVASSLVVVETEGDKRADVPLDRLGGRGVFVKEVQVAVLAGDADAAVHSAKDLPASADHQLEGLVLAAFPERADPRDVLVGGGLSSLPTGSMVATGSARRRAQVGNLRPDLAFCGLRGNLATRLGAVGTGGVAAVVVAKAALDRLGWSPGDGMPVEVLEPEVIIPQVGQGVLAVECQAQDVVTRRALAAIDDPGVRTLVTAERAFLSELGGGCTLPVGAHAVFVGADPASTADVEVRGPVGLTGILASGDGRVVLRHRLVGDDPVDLGRAVARYLLDDGGGSEFVEWELPSLSRAVDDARVEG
jgi:hydroxymethylbilane synthase